MKNVTSTRGNRARPPSFPKFRLTSASMLIVGWPTLSDYPPIRWIIQRHRKGLVCLWSNLPSKGRDNNSTNRQTRRRISRAHVTLVRLGLGEGPRLLRVWFNAALMIQPVGRLSSWYRWPRLLSILSASPSTTNEGCPVVPSRTSCRAWTCPCP